MYDESRVVGFIYLNFYCLSLHVPQHNYQSLCSKTDGNCPKAYQNIGDVLVQIDGVM